MYSNVTKVMIDSRAGSNLLYLPLDKLLQQGGTAGRRHHLLGQRALPGAPQHERADAAACVQL